MSEAERCPRCDLELATAEDDKHDVECFCARCKAVCWRRFERMGCIGIPIDWRARALVAEASLTRIRSALVAYLGSDDQGQAGAPLTTEQLVEVVLRGKVP